MNELESLKEKQKIEMEQLKQKMRNLKKKHKKDIKELTNKIEILIKQTQKIEVCRICYTNEPQQCPGCQMEICQQCGTNCQQNDCEAVFCQNCKDKGMYIMNCGTILCQFCTDYHHKICGCYKQTKWMIERQVIVGKHFYIHIHIWKYS